VRSWLLGHGELAVRFIRAWAAATEWLLAPRNQAETLELIITKEKLSPAAAEDAYRKVVPKARINPAALEIVIVLRKEMGVYQPPLSPKSTGNEELYSRD
jgi:ABC-type nitrate/sulfonate/bicarbonate transport system substrate-binding protein